MAPSPGWWHVNVTANLIATIGVYARINKLGMAFADNFDVHFPDGNLFQPDFIFVSAENAKLLFQNKDNTIILHEKKTLTRLKACVNIG